MYGPLNKFGPTLPGTEGEEWKALRKVAGPSFSEKTIRQVWNYSCDRSAYLRASWLEDEVVQKLHQDLAKVTFHVISFVCFNKVIPWSPSSNSDAQKEPLPSGHKLSYGDALTTVFDYMPLIFLMPSWILSFLPLPACRLAKLGLDEWRKYVGEMRASRSRALTTKKHDGLNLLDSLVLAGDQKLISESSLEGNIFVFHAAGYETTGSTLAFCIMILACLPPVQEKVQAEIDLIRQRDNLRQSRDGVENVAKGSDGHTAESPYHYDKFFNTLLDGYTGAVIAETLRLFPTLSYLPKTTPTGEQQQLNIDGHSYMIPPNTLVMIASDATHRNPKIWGEPRPSTTRTKFLHNFDPDRWILKGGQRMHPPSGSYLPFSAGQRACIGQRFALVEMCATLVSLLSDHKLVLARADGSPVSADSEDWTTVRDQTFEKMEENIFFSMTLRYPSQPPLRLIPR